MLRGMLKARWGRVINVGSVVGRMGNLGQGNYVASKAGLEGFTRSLAMEVASRGITVNAVAPGFIETDMTNALSDDQSAAMLERIPLGRMGSVNEIAATVGFLCSRRVHLPDSAMNGGCISAKCTQQFQCNAWAFSVIAGMK